MPRKQSLRLMTTQNEEQTFYPKGKSTKVQFLDEGQWNCLLQDSTEYSPDPAFQAELLKYVEQLKPVNVFPALFDFKYSLQEYEDKIQEMHDSFKDSDTYFKSYLRGKSQVKLKNVDEFNEYFACHVCCQVFDAQTRIGNKSCSICAYNCCQGCYRKLQDNR